MERVHRDVGKWTRVVGALPDVQSALMLAAARSRDTAGTRYGIRHYLDMNRLKEQEHAIIRATGTATTRPSCGGTLFKYAQLDGNYPKIFSVAGYRHI